MLLCLIIFSFLLVAFLFLTPLILSLVLVLVSIGVVSFVGFSFLSSGLLLLVILLVYIGAIIIIIGYVCAVSPNLNYTQILPPIPAFLVSSLVSLLIFVVFDFHVAFSNISFSASVSFLYGYFGFLVFFGLVFYIFIVLYSASSFTQINAPFRSF